MTTILSLSRTAARRLTRPSLGLFAARAASSSAPHLAGHPGPSTPYKGTNPSDEARKAAELLQKLQDDPEKLNQIHDDQTMYFKPEGPDSLPGDRDYKRKAHKKP